jgi:hypothetical protein
VYEPFALIACERLCKSRYNILVSQAQERLWVALVIKFKLAYFEVLTVVLLIPEVVWNIYCVACTQLLTFQSIIVPSTSGSNGSRLLDPVVFDVRRKLVVVMRISSRPCPLKQAIGTQYETHKHSCLAIIKISKLKKISKLYAKNGTKTVHI